MAAQDEGVSLCEDDAVAAKAQPDLFCSLSAIPSVFMERRETEFQFAKSEDCHSGGLPSDAILMAEQ